MRVIPLGDGVVRALTAWRERSKFKGQGDLIFPNWLGGFYDHRGMIKQKFDPLFAALRKRWDEMRRNEPLETFPGTRCGTSPFRAGSMRDCRQKPCRPLPAT